MPLDLDNMPDSKIVYDPGTVHVLWITSMSCRCTTGSDSFSWTNCAIVSSLSLVLLSSWLSLSSSSASTAGGSFSKAQDALFYPWSFSEPSRSSSNWKGVGSYCSATLAVRDWVSRGKCCSIIVWTRTLRLLVVSLLELDSREARGERRNCVVFFPYLSHCTCETKSQNSSTQNDYTNGYLSFPV